MNLCYNDGHESLRDAVRESVREVAPGFRRDNPLHCEPPGWKAAP